MNSFQFDYSKTFCTQCGSAEYKHYHEDEEYLGCANCGHEFIFGPDQACCLIKTEGHDECVCEHEAFSLYLEELIRQVRQHEREGILEKVLAMEKLSHDTRTPIYQDTFFDKMKQILYADYSPQSSKDAPNEE
jgi:hypothetical protein